MSTSHGQRDARVSPTLRLPEARDYEALASWVPDAAACLRWAGPRVPYPLDVPSLANRLAVPGAASYVLAQGSGPALAFGQHWPTPVSAAHLGRLIVSPAMRGRGLGRVLCEQLVARAVQATGAAAVTLKVYRDNVRALSLYASLGFVEQEEHSEPGVLFMRAQVGRCADSRH